MEHILYSRHIHSAAIDVDSVGIIVPASEWCCYWCWCSCNIPHHTWICVTSEWEPVSANHILIERNMYVMVGMSPQLKTEESDMKLQVHWWWWLLQGCFCLIYFLSLHEIDIGHSRMKWAWEKCVNVCNINQEIEYINFAIRANCLDKLLFLFSSSFSTMSSFADDCCRWRIRLRITIKLGKLIISRTFVTQSHFRIPECKRQA